MPLVNNQQDFNTMQSVEVAEIDAAAAQAEVIGEREGTLYRTPMTESPSQGVYNNQPRN